MGRLRQARDYLTRHPKAKAAAYLAATIAMLAMLTAGGALRNPFAPHQPDPAPPASSQRGEAGKNDEKRKPAKDEPAATDPDWPTLAQRTAKDRLAAMNGLLAEPAGLNGASVGDYVKPQSSDTDSEYTTRQNAFTDAAKTALAATPSSPEQAGKQASAVTSSYQAWQDALWRAANETLRGQLAQMDESYRPVRTWIKEHPGYPEPCRSWASTITEDGSKGADRRAFEAQVARVAAFDAGQKTCAAAMSPEQASRLPQKGSEPIDGGR